MWRPKNPLLRASVLLCLAVLGQAQAAEDDDLTAIPFETLVQTEVVSASRIARQISDSPSAVAIVTAADIRAYGYRTLADVIGSMRGLFTTYDYMYQYMGGRGFGKPGEYAGRVMLLIDGYATQDSLYNQAFIDESGFLDMAVIERVEYVPGTGSVTYGNNALLGIINVVTKRGSDFNGVQLSTEMASDGGRRQRMTYGKQFENGANVLLSASGFDSKGQDLYLHSYDSPIFNNGVATNADSERNRRLFAKLEYDGLTLEGGYVSRQKSVPTNPRATASYTYPTRFDSPYRTWDENAFFSARYETDVNLHLRSSTHFYWGSYADKAFRRYDTVAKPDPEEYRSNMAEGQWWGLDQKFVANWFDNHTTVFGVESRRDYRQSFYKEYLLANMQINRIEEPRTARTTTSFYVTDEYSLSRKWTLNAGLRFDAPSDVQSHVSPRLALVHNYDAATTIKASYSEAFRLPNADERISSTTPPAEYVAASELVLVRELSPNLRYTGSLYRYALKKKLLPALSSTDYSYTHGLEQELEGHWDNGVRLRTSVAFQNSRDTTGKHAANAPFVLGKFNLSFPILANSWRTGFETQYMGERKTLIGNHLGGVAVSNLTFSSEKKWEGLSVSFSIRNLLDRRYEVVSPFDEAVNALLYTSRGQPANTGVQDTLPMPGRTFWLQLNYDL